MQTIGFIGVGNIGMAICKHLIDAGHKVLGYRRSSLAEFEKIGGVAATSPADVGIQADIVFSCLPGGDSLDDVVTGPNGLLKCARKGQIVAELGSHPIAVKERNAARFAEKGVTFVDGEVSGTPGMVMAKKARRFISRARRPARGWSRRSSPLQTYACISAPSARPARSSSSTISWSSSTPRPSPRRLRSASESGSIPT
jgi:3-hydroxyisobutyrate dehydrogenase-like beta-hydroxyacid dehydrogenase